MGFLQDRTHRGEERIEGDFNQSVVHDEADATAANHADCERAQEAHPPETTGRERNREEGKNTTRPGLHDRLAGALSNSLARVPDATGSIIIIVEGHGCIGA